MSLAEYKTINWRIGFAVFCLLYALVVIYLGLDNFDKVHSEYRWAVAQLHPDRIRERAAQELTAQCRKESRREVKRSDRYRPGSETVSVAGEDGCLSWPEADLARQGHMVENRLKDEAGRLKRRMIVFYITFTGFFLFLPLVFLYMVLALLVWLFKGVKIIR